MALAGNGRFRLGGYRWLRISSPIAISLNLAASSRLSTLSRRSARSSKAVIQP